jgi:ankyrin repeat protein
MEMKTILSARVTLVTALVIAAFLPRVSGGATNDPSADLQKGLFEEEANHNFPAAIQAYQSVITRLDDDRKLAATAIFRLGEVYRKQGKTNEALAQYERVVRDFSDQSTLATLSRQEVAGLGSTPPAGGAPLSSAGRQEQKRLLEEEIKLAEANLAQQQKRVENGALAPGELWPTQREILDLKRQLVAVESGEPGPNSAKDPLTSSEAEEIKRIRDLIKDSPDLINAADKGGLTLLQTAAGKGELAIVKLLLDNGAAVNGIKQPDLTPLHYAAGNGHKAVVDLLLSQGAEVDSRTESGTTPLHLAALNGYTVVAKTLLDAGAPVNARVSRDVNRSDLVPLQLSAGQTPLHAAAEAGYSALVELLIARGADVNAEDAKDGRTPLSYAAQTGNEAIAKTLLAARADPNRGRSDLPLNIAADKGNAPLLELLLSKGANPNTNTVVDWDIRTRFNFFQPGSSVTPLFLAASQHHSEAVKELIRFKADPNGLTANDSLLFYAFPNTETLKALLEGGANPNMRNNSDVSPLDFAISENNAAAVEELLAHGTDANSTNRSGWSPLHAAAASGNKAIAEMLLKNGADVNARAIDWRTTPLFAAIPQDHQELAELLLANKADPNARNQEGYTPLHVAVSQSRQNMVELLLAHKADPNARNNGGQTPLDLAKSPQPGAPPGMRALNLPVGLPGNYPGSASIPSRPTPSPVRIEDLLRQHGAVEDLPRLDRIEVRRPSASFSAVVFLKKETNDWNQFTLLELIAVHYELLTASPNGRLEQSNRARTISWLHFPDFAHVRLRRPAPDLKSWQDRTLDLTAAFQSGDCSDDLPLEWGDVLEIPEADHPLNANWQGLAEETTNTISKCLTRQVEVVVKGQSTKLSLVPGDALEEHSGRTFVRYATFMVKPVLDHTKLLLASSDLSRVKVKRQNPAAGKPREWIVDCSQYGNEPDLWLRDGDVIEVPDKP